MYDSWIEAWELPMPSTAAWEEKGMAEQVQVLATGEGLENGGCFLLEDVDDLLALDPSCEDPPLDLTAIIGNLIGEEEEVSVGCGSLPENLMKVEAADGCSGFDVANVIYELQDGTQMPFGWLESSGLTAVSPVTIELNDLLPTHISAEEYCYQSTDCEESCETATVSYSEAAEELQTTDRRKSARKRKVQEPASIRDTGWLAASDDDENELRSGEDSSSGVAAEKRSKMQAALDKNSAEYRMRRDRNNKFVRASREKARRRHVEVEESLNRVTIENKELRTKVETLTREVEILRGLFVSIGAEIPRDVVTRINVATQPLTLSNIHD